MSEIPRVYYNKLVRDNIPDKIRPNQEACDVRVITDSQELQQELFKKVQEEAAALSKCRTAEDFLAEYSDLQVVLDTLLVQISITPEEAMAAKAANLLKKGDYKQAYFLNWSDDGVYKSNESTQGIPSK